MTRHTDCALFVPCFLPHAPLHCLARNQTCLITVSPIPTNMQHGETGRNDGVDFTVRHGRPEHDKPIAQSLMNRKVCSIRQIVGREYSLTSIRNNLEESKSRESPSLSQCQPDLRPEPGKERQKPVSAHPCRAGRRHGPQSYCMQRLQQHGKGVVESAQSGMLQHAAD